MSKLTRLRPLLIGGNQVDLKRLEEVEELREAWRKVILFILNQRKSEEIRVTLEESISYYSYEIRGKQMNYEEIISY